MNASLPLFMLIPALLASSLNCGSSCTLVGCDSRVSSTTTIASDTAALDGATLTICRNDNCVDGTIRASTRIQNGETLPIVICEFPDNEEERFVSGRRSCLGTVSGSDVTLGLHYALGNDEAPLNGDIYRFEVRSPTDPSDVLVTSEAAVKYTVHQPNGPDCAPTCYNAEL